MQSQRVLHIRKSSALPACLLLTLSTKFLLFSSLYLLCRIVASDTTLLHYTVIYLKLSNYLIAENHGGFRMESARFLQVVK